MSYHTVIQLTDALTTKIQSSSLTEDAFEDVFDEIQEILEETRDASYHRTSDPRVQERFRSLYGQLSVFSRGLKPSDYLQTTWQTLQALMAVSERVAEAPPLPEGSPDDAGVPPLDPETALKLIVHAPDQLCAQAQQELRADPDSIVGAYLLGAAQLCLHQYADAIATANTLAVRYPARHVSTIVAMAAIMQGREQHALQSALHSLHRRLEARRPQHWHRIAGLRTLSDEEANLIKQVNTHLIQRGLNWCTEQEWPEAKRMVFIGLLAPSLTQARNMLIRGMDAVETTWREAALAGLARCERWRCAFQNATAHLDGLSGSFVDAEHTLIHQDRSLLSAGEIELSGFGTRLRLVRTTNSIGFAIDGIGMQGTDASTPGAPVAGMPAAGMSAAGMPAAGIPAFGEYHFTRHEEQDEAQVADMLKDEVCSWILTGFQHMILSDGPIEEEYQDEPIIPEPEATFNVEYFFELYGNEDIDGIRRYANSVIQEHPYAPTPWGALALVHLIQGRWDMAAEAARCGIQRSGCRALAAPLVLMPLAEEDYGQALSIAMDILALRLRSATPEAPLVLPGFPNITTSEGALLDQIEHNAWRIVQELLDEHEAESEEQELEQGLLLALLNPSPASMLSELEEMLPDLASRIGLKVIALVTLSRWRRQEGLLDVAAHWLSQAERLLPGLSYARQERARLERDQHLLDCEEVILRGFGVTIELRRADHILHRVFTLDWSSQTHAMAAWIEGNRPNSDALVLRDAAVSWLESGFTLLSDAPDE